MSWVLEPLHGLENLGEGGASPYTTSLPACKYMEKLEYPGYGRKTREWVVEAFESARWPVTYLFVRLLRP